MRYGERKKKKHFRRECSLQCIYLLHNKHFKFRLIPEKTFERLNSASLNQILY